MQLRFHQEVKIPAGKVNLEGELLIPLHAKGIVIFAHGSGSSRFSRRNRQVADYLHKKNFGTLLFDLLTREEDSHYANRFNISLLAKRLAAATEWLEGLPEAEDCSVGYFGASTGAAAALKVAALLPQVKAIVSRGGRPDLAMDDLENVDAPTLLIVGSLDYDVLKLNREAYILLGGEKKLEIVNGAEHLFEEPGALEKVAGLAGSWFEKHLKKIMV